jgi:hypothetical protein
MTNLLRRSKIREFTTLQEATDAMQKHRAQRKFLYAPSGTGKTHFVNEIRRTHPAYLTAPSKTRSEAKMKKKNASGAPRENKRAEKQKVASAGSSSSSNKDWRKRRSGRGDTARKHRPPARPPRR